MNEYFWDMDSEIEKLREELYRKLRLSKSDFQDVWGELERTGKIDEYCSESVDNIEDLVYEARQTAAYRKTKNERGRPVQEIKERYAIDLSSKVRERVRLTSKALAKQAAGYEIVREFRKEVLQGVLSPEVAARFVFSPATKTFSKRWFSDWKIPPVNHMAKVVTTDADLPGFKKTASTFMEAFGPPERYVRIHVDPPGITKSVLYASTYKEVPGTITVDKHLPLPELDENGARSLENTVRYPWKGKVRKVRVFPGSLLDQANNIARLLGTMYAWQDHDALLFLLTGEYPEIDPLQISYSLLVGSGDSPPVWNISLKATPWIPLKEVTAAFKEVQKQILRGDSSMGSIKAERSLATFEFILDQEKQPSTSEEWDDLFEEWNQTYPQKSSMRFPKAKYPKKPSHDFKAAFDDVNKRYLQPKYYLPKRKTRNDLEKWEEEELLRKREEAIGEIRRIDFLLQGGDTEDID